MKTQPITQAQANDLINRVNGFRASVSACQGDEIASPSLAVLAYRLYCQVDTLRDSRPRKGAERLHADAIGYVCGAIDLYTRRVAAYVPDWKTFAVDSLPRQA